MSRLFYKYLIPYLLIAIVPVLVTGFAFYWVLGDNIKQLEQNLIEENSKVLREEISSKNENIARNEGLNIELEIDRIGNKLNALTLSPDFIDFNHNEINRYISNLIASEPAILKAFVINEFAEIVLKREGFIALNTEDVAPTLLTQINDSLSKRKSYISDVMHSNSNQSSFVLIAQPIIDMAGNYKGGCIFEIDLTFLNNYLLSTRLDEKSIIYLVSADGKLISHPSPKEMSQNSDYSKYRYIQQMLKNESGTFLREQTLISHYRNKYNWIVIVEIPVEQALKSVNKNRLSILQFTSDTIESTIYTTSITIVFILIIAILMGIYLTKKITNPLETLTQASEKISSGDLELKALPIRSKDEIGRLTQAFNIMILELRKSQKELILSNEKIKEQAETLLKRYNSDLEQFAYVTTHDLIEPLRMITSYMQLIQRRHKDIFVEGKSKNYMQFVEEGVRRMHSIINDLFEYSHIRTNVKDVEPVALDTVLKQVLEKLNKEIEDSNAKITAGPLPELKADASNMAQVFQNLIGNAIKFKSDRPLEIKIISKDKGDHYLFSVADNGIGFEQKYAGKVFEIFKRLNTRDEFKGSGMGLAICKNIIERHGGKIWVESEPGIGTTFYFTLKKH
ncbi:MAG: ATP-binding protein [Chitinophagales bacterium]